MRALVFRGPWHLDVEHLPDPAPGPGEVAIRVAATGICGSDLHGFTGENERRYPGQIMGHETVGTVMSHGEGVPADTPPVGSVVTVNPLISCSWCAACRAGAQQACARRRVIGVDPDYVSAFADVMLAPHGNVVPLPADMPIAYGALVEPLAVGRHAAGRGGCGPGDLVLVIGGGPIGQASALAARRLGATRVVVSEPNPKRRRLLHGLGFDTIDPQEQPASEATLGALGDPADLVIDAAGSSTTIGDAVACSSFGSRIVLVGMNTPRLEIAAYAFSTEERSLIGSFCYTAAEFAETATWVGSTPPGLDLLVEAEVGLDEAPATFTTLARGELDASKVLVILDPSTNGAAR